MRQAGLYAYRTRRVLIVALLGLATVTAYTWAQPSPGVPSSPSDVTVCLDPAQSKLNWTLGSSLHTVHGTFNLKRGTLKFDPVTGNASGEFVVIATSGESGNDSRDRKMHGEILESARYPDIIFHPTMISGKVAVPGTSDVQIHGKFILHGGEHEITVPVHSELTANRWKGSAKFAVPYIEWGLKSPNGWLLKADPTVEIELELSGTLQAAVAH